MEIQDNTSVQVEQTSTTQEESKKYNAERTYDIGDIRKSMKLILPKELYESKDLTRSEKKVLAVILHTCRSDAYKKLGGYYPITNANLKKNGKRFCVYTIVAFSFIRTFAP